MKDDKCYGLTVAIISTTMENAKKLLLMQDEEFKRTGQNIFNDIYGNRYILLSNDVNSMRGYKFDQIIVCGFSADDTIIETLKFQCGYGDNKVPDEYLVQYAL